MPTYSNLSFRNAFEEDLQPGKTYGEEISQKLPRISHISTANVLESSNFVRRVYEPFKLGHDQNIRKARGASNR